MLETPHALVGAALAVKIGNPLLSIPLAFLSHFVLDRIPHWNPHFYTETQKYGKPTRKSTIIAVVDSVVALTTGLFIASKFLPNYNLVLTIVATCLASVLSDQIKLPYFFLKRRSGFFRKWTEFERSMQVSAPFVPGITTQVLVIAASILWLAN